MGPEFDGPTAGPGRRPKIDKTHLTEGPRRAQNLTYYPSLLSWLVARPSPCAGLSLFFPLALADARSHVLHRVL